MTDPITEARELLRLWGAWNNSEGVDSPAWREYNSLAANHAPSIAAELIRAQERIEELEFIPTVVRGEDDHETLEWPEDGARTCRVSRELVQQIVDDQNAQRATIARLRKALEDGLLFAQCPGDPECTQGECWWHRARQALNQEEGK